jgi:pantoate--beta-alanine ligase
MSSRNVFLGDDERRAATGLNRALERARATIAAGERDPRAVERTIRDTVAGEPGVDLQYASAVAADDFRPLERLAGDVVLPVAARVGPVRLLDNCRVRVDS